MLTTLFPLAEALAAAYQLDTPNKVDNLTVWSPKAGDPVGVFVEHRQIPETDSERVDVWTWTEAIFSLKTNPFKLVTLPDAAKIYGPIIKTAYALTDRLSESANDLTTATKRIEDQEREIVRLKAVISTMSAERGIIHDR